ncbi:hypothetical protein [[Mycoplasma] testudinis]|uniref:hypothetical protein n=1 Tax=[Mycoplasma] testudinis TaxID=33924 RepID=UPI000A80457A|nr:hypothetical protein [[Mycoplasma] testudinis]
MAKNKNNQSESDQRPDNHKRVSTIVAGVILAAIVILVILVIVFLTNGSRRG